MSYYFWGIEAKQFLVLLNIKKQIDYFTIQPFNLLLESSVSSHIVGESSRLLILVIFNKESDGNLFLIGHIFLRSQEFMVTQSQKFMVTQSQEFMVTQSQEFMVTQIIHGHRLLDSLVV